MVLLYEYIHMYICFHKVIHYEYIHVCICINEVIPKWYYFMITYVCVYVLIQ